MNKDLYPMIFKRKSFHTYMNKVFNTGSLTLDENELEDIKNTYYNLSPLYPDIKTEIVIRKEKESGCHRGNEYTIYFYSENKDNYLANIGYLGEQLDLYLTSKNIGTLWYGLGKEKGEYNGLDFVIMMGIRKVDEDKFRKDMYKSKRKSLEDVWKLDEYKEIGDIVRFAPSACNSQPWEIRGNSKELEIYRYRYPGKVSLMNIENAFYFNRIDIGIFICFLELVLKQNNIDFNRELFIDNINQEYALFAKYELKGS